MRNRAGSPLLLCAGLAAASLTDPTTAEPPGRSVRFAEVGSASGVDFTHTHGGSGELYYVETVGSGGGFLDYDGDGSLDIYLVNGAPLPGYRYEVPPANRLYRNNSQGLFTDVTAATSAGDTAYGMGCAAADYDNDGDADLYVTNFGANTLYRNETGRFAEITATAGVGDSLWSTAAAWIDYDNDGQLDLFVANYVDFEVEYHIPCYDWNLRAYCGPDSYDSVPDRLYHNEGEGHFRDVTAATGMTEIAQGKGLGVACSDYDLDGDVDLFVANDRVANQLLINGSDGRFEEAGMMRGVSHNGGGEVEAGMGVDFGDFDLDGYQDLFVVNFSFETHTLYRNLANGFFSDVTSIAGLTGPTLLPLAWGARFLDFDNDGDLDLFCANGHVLHNIDQMEKVLTYKQPNQLFRNDDGHFADVSSAAGLASAVPWVSRGAAFADYDDDGDVDILVNNNNGPAELLRNDGGNNDNSGRWLTVHLTGTRSNRDGIGARIELWSGGRRQVKEVVSGASYLASNDPRIHFGLGAEKLVERVKVHWPSGQADSWEDLPVNRMVTLREGEGD